MKTEWNVSSLGSLIDNIELVSRFGSSYKFEVEIDKERKLKFEKNLYDDLMNIKKTSTGNVVIFEENNPERIIQIVTHSGGIITSRPPFILFYNIDKKSLKIEELVKKIEFKYS